MEAELRSLQQKDVWDLVEQPVYRKAVGSKWVFKLKTDSDGRIERLKARIVAQGFSQQTGADYDEIFSSVVRLELVRAVISLAVRNRLNLYQFDITTAFLNGKLQETVYMKQPEGFISAGQEHFVCRLKQSIYGLKQSSCCWHSTIDNCLKQLGYLPLNSDPCVYVAAMDDDLAIVGVYVDDIIFACKRVNKLKQFE